MKPPDSGMVHLMVNTTAKDMALIRQWAKAEKMPVPRFIRRVLLDMDGRCSRDLVNLTRWTRKKSGFREGTVLRVIVTVPK